VVAGTAAEAATAAERWADKAGVSVELVAAEPAARQVATVLSAVWPQPNGTAPVTPELAWALAHSGNYVALAVGPDGPVGAAVGFRAADGEGHHLHSHIAGVVPARQGGSVGFALKQHQRAWALGAGLTRITWTFDPLVARNAYFNVMKLGAGLTRYYVDFYGALSDGINVGDESDRCLVTWWLTGQRAAAAASGATGEVDLAALCRMGAVEVLGPGPGHEPVLQAAPAQATRLARVPADVVELRHRDPAMARRWRQALREVLTTTFAEGLEVEAVSRDGCYVIGARRRPAR